MRLLYVNIMWFNQLQVTTGQPLCDTQPCAILWLSVGQQCCRGSVDEPRGTLRSCLLNPLACQPISCQATTNGWPGYDLQGHGGGLHFDGQLIYTQQRHSSVDRQCPCWSQSIARVQLEHLYSTLIDGKLKLTSHFKYINLCTYPSSCMSRIKSSAEKKKGLSLPIVNWNTLTVSGALLKTGDSPVLETQLHIKKSIKQNPNPRSPEYNW